MTLRECPERYMKLLGQGIIRGNQVMTKKTKRHVILITAIVIGVLLFSVSIIDSKYVLGKNFTDYLQKISGQPMNIRKELKVTYNNNNYVITLGTPVDKEDELYANTFEGKLAGLIYKPTYGALQGKSKSLYGMLQVYIEDGSDKNFNVIYGYNKDFKAGSYEVQKFRTNQFVKEDISHQEYFLQTYQDIVYPLVAFKDQDDTDISNFFINGN
jgi:hypothetical protein